MCSESRAAKHLQGFPYSVCSAVALEANNQFHSISGRAFQTSPKRARTLGEESAGSNGGLFLVSLIGQGFQQFFDFCQLRFGLRFGHSGEFTAELEELAALA
jgi:hypothetical protein